MNAGGGALPTAAAAQAASAAQAKTNSKTITDTVVGALWRDVLVGPAKSGLTCCCSTPLFSRPAGEHTHTIVGYSLVKGIGDGEPIASERFSVGGHEWVSCWAS